MNGKPLAGLRVKRAYEAPARNDGARILVDRIWPRGVTKAELRLDDWMKELAPSKELRQWFGHDPAKWDAFRERYFRELERHDEAIERLLAKCGEGEVTLVYGAKDEEHNNAVALASFLRQRA